MSNIAKKLRKHADDVLDPGYPFYGTPELVRKAATALDQLQANCDEMRAVENELKALKALVRKFLKETRYVPYRYVDCDPIVHDLIDQMYVAVKPTRKRKRCNK